MHRVKIMVETEKKDFFGNRKKVLEEKWIEVDNEIYEQIKAEDKIDSMEVEDMVLMDWFLK